MDGEEADACWIYACDDEVCADVALVAEKVLFQHGHDGDDSWRATGGEGVKFKVGGDEGGGELRVGCCTSACAPNGRGDVVEFFAVLERVLCQLRPIKRSSLFLQRTLSATIGPLVALVSAAI